MMSSSSKPRTPFKKYQWAFENLGPSSVSVSHEFLDISEEAELERRAVFNQKKNLSTIESVIRVFLDLRTLDDSVVVVSVGTSSTQMYNKTIVIGSFYLGMDVINEQPEKLRELFDSIVSSLRNKQIKCSALLLISAIGYSVTKTTFINTLPPPQEDRSSNNLTLEQRMVADLWRLANAHDINTIVISAADSKISSNWLYAKSQVALSGSGYLVDFGGGGVNVKYYEPNKPLVDLGKNRLIRGNQDAFVNDIIGVTPESTAVVEHRVRQILDAVMTLIEPHAIENNTFPAQCKILQTGRAREAFYQTKSSSASMHSLRSIGEISEPFGVWSIFARIMLCLLALVRNISPF